MRAGSIVAAVIVVVAACGGNKSQSPADAPVNPAVCNNGILEGDEDCDDGDTIVDVVCDATCHFTCGNGTLDSTVGELCDTGIAPGAPGACPTGCDDAMACTADVLSVTACTTSCLHSDITVPADNDGCCPPGADATTDNDCAAVCGNMIVEPPVEVCDTGIASGPGACPATCNDGQSCTSDALTGGGTCSAACVFTSITMPINNDGCCPPGANATTDNDCLPGCGNGVHEPPAETCDTAIATGPGSCPTTCADGMVCTTDVLLNPGTCTAACSFQPIINPINNDGCCPPGANANNDNDCTPVCPNGVTEMGEQCDDGNLINNDACTNMCRLPPTAFRFSDLDLRDPHVYVNIPIFGCRDVTDTPPPFSSFTVNGEIQANIQMDGDGDGLLDLSPTLVFRPFTQVAAAMTPLEVHFADCTSPIATTACTTSATPPTLATSTNQAAGTCLAPLPGTIFPYAPAIVSPGGPCFFSNAVTVTVDVGGIPITLQNAQVAATYVGNPANTMANGLLRGFITEADANATIIPASFPLVGGQPLSSLLPGGNGNCAGHSDKDTVAGVVGWWFYLNYPATRVPWTD